MMEVQVRHFTYNGFGGLLREGYAPYTATLIRWTADPGIGLFRCSDGKERLIPTFALPYEHPDWQRPQDLPPSYNPISYIGEPSQS